MTFGVALNTVQSHPRKEHGVTLNAVQSHPVSYIYQVMKFNSSNCHFKVKKILIDRSILMQHGNASHIKGLKSACLGLPCT